MVYCGENTWVLEPQTAVMSFAENIHIPPGIPSESGPLYSDFFEQQVAKQRNNNYHSTSLVNMVATSVNRTALHPGGVQYVSPTFLSFSLSPCPPCRRLVILVKVTNSSRPGNRHTELEEELHEHAHIDYDRVAIVCCLP